MTLQIASRRIVGNLQRRAIVVELHPAANLITWARRRGCAYRDGGSIVIELKSSFYVRSADLILCWPSRDVVDLHIAVYDSILD